MRVFVVKAFRRFQRKEKIDDAALCEAIERAERGLVDADLGSGLIKQRVARTGQGRSGSYRTIIAYREGHRSAFLLGFAKSDRANIDEKEHRALTREGEALLRLNEKQLEALVDDEQLWEIEFNDGD